MPLRQVIRRFLLGQPKNLREPGVLHKISLVALLAWVGLGADGLSSSAYGPEEMFRALGDHKALAVILAIATAVTIFIISYGYSRIIEQFPAGGGGYVVASKILGPRAGVISGSALLVDYVLTISISIASGADAVLSFLPQSFHSHKVAFAIAGIVVLAVLNLRGIKESVLSISPIFALFVVTHVVILAVALGGHVADLGHVVDEVKTDLTGTVSALGVAGTLHLLLRAYALGGGTYTGIEAVSNGVPIMREPRVDTAKRTMFLMASSLAVMASGIVLAYLLVGVEHVPGQTMNAVLIDRVAGNWRVLGFDVGGAFVVAALLSEAGLLLIAAQAGFLDGPRVMSNMAIDSWLPHRFSAISDRLTMRNGVLLMSFAAAAAVIYTGGSVSKLVVMYSINVFLTFSMSNIAMFIYWFRHRAKDPEWRKHALVHALASALCLTILVVTVFVRFTEGGWLTLVITFGVVVMCFLTHHHYQLVGWAIELLDVSFPGPERGEAAQRYYEGLLMTAQEGEPDPSDPVAIVFVGGYSALGRKTLVTLLRMFPGHYKGVVFVSIAIVDSGVFKGVNEIGALEKRTMEALNRYEKFAESLGLRSMAMTATGTEIAVEAEAVIRLLIGRYPRATVVAGQLIFEEDTLWNRLLHNETAFLIQRRLQYSGIPMVVLPVQLDLRAVDPRRMFRFLSRWTRQSDQRV